MTLEEIEQRVAEIEKAHPMHRSGADAMNIGFLIARLKAANEEADRMRAVAKYVSTGTYPSLEEYGKAALAIDLRTQEEG